MGDMLLTSVPEGWESNPHKNQVVQPTSYALVVWLPIPLRSRTLRKFQTNGSQTIAMTAEITNLTVCLPPHRVAAFLASPPQRCSVGSFSGSDSLLQGPGYCVRARHHIYAFV